MIRLKGLALLAFVFSPLCARPAEMNNLWPSIHGYFQDLYPSQTLLLASSPANAGEIPAWESIGQVDAETIAHEVGYVRIGERFICRIGVGLDQGQSAAAMKPGALIALAECLPLAANAPAKAAPLELEFRRAKEQMFSRQIQPAQVSRTRIPFRPLPRILKPGKIFLLDAPLVGFPLETLAIAPFTLDADVDPKTVFTRTSNVVFWRLSDQVGCRRELTRPPIAGGNEVRAPI